MGWARTGGQGNREADWGDDRSAKPKKLTGAGKDRKLEELAEITTRSIGFRGE